MPQTVPGRHDQNTDSVIKKFEEVAQMNNKKANESIKCTVQQCAHHCDDCDYCTLGSINIGTHEMNPTMVECTDCNSFQLKK